MSIAPCPNESDYTMGNTVDFGLIDGAYAYSPKCLTLTLPATGGAGLEVTFTGDFVAHPLEPSALRGAQSGNPITSTSAGTSKMFTILDARLLRVLLRHPQPVGQRRRDVGRRLGDTAGTPPLTNMKTEMR